MRRHHTWMLVRVLLTVVALGATGCAGAAQTEAGEPPSERTVQLDEAGAGGARAGTEAASATPSEPIPLREAGSDRLPAGTYTTSVFKPGFTFAVDDGWYQLIELPYVVILHRGGLEDGDLVLFANMSDTQVFDPPFLTDAEVFDPERREEVLRDAPDLVQHLQTVDELRADDPHHVTIGDRPATLLPYDVTDLPETPETCPEVPEQCIFLLGRGTPPDSFEFFVTENDPGRLWILDEQEPGLLIAGPAADDGAFAAHTDELLATIAFHEPAQ